MSSSQQALDKFLLNAAETRLLDTHKHLSSGRCVHTVIYPNLLVAVAGHWLISKSEGLLWDIGTCEVTQVHESPAPFMLRHNGRVIFGALWKENTEETRLRKVCAKLYSSRGSLSVLHNCIFKANALFKQ